MKNPRGCKTQLQKVGIWTHQSLGVTNCTIKDLSGLDPPRTSPDTHLWLSSLGT